MNGRLTMEVRELDMKVALDAASADNEFQPARNAHVGTRDG